MVDLIFPAEKDWHHQGANMLELQQHLAHSFEDASTHNGNTFKIAYTYGIHKNAHRFSNKNVNL